MKTTRIFLLVVAGIVGVPVLIIGGFMMHGCSAATGLVDKAIDVTVAQFDPATMLKKYEWFKDAAAQCDKKLADIHVYENRFQSLMSDYTGKSRSDWSKEDREQYNIWISEVSGIQASYNALAADYNASMAKINYAFCNIGMLPQGATDPLPREFKPYITQ